MNKKAFITSPGDLAKGLIVGLIIGALIIYLMAKGIIPFSIVKCAVSK